MLGWGIADAECSSFKLNSQKNASPTISSIPSAFQKPKIVRGRSLERNKKLSAVASASGQTRITNYFKILNEVEHLMTTNEILQETIRNMQSSTQYSTAATLLKTQPDSLLKMLLNSAIKHRSKHKSGYRHD